MKASLLLALFLATGCLKNTEENIPGGKFERLDPQPLASEDYDRVKAICDAIESKEERLPALEGSSYTFTYAERGCTEVGPVKEKDVKVTIQREGQNYIFAKASEDHFAFANVETKHSGTMSVICDKLSEQKSPVQTSSRGAVWYTTFTPTSACVSDYNHLCIYLKKGEVVEGVAYRIHSEEWIRFKVRDERTGFFVERMLVSEADCSSGKNIEKRAQLK